MRQDCSISQQTVLEIHICIRLAFREEFLSELDFALVLRDVCLNMYFLVFFGELTECIEKIACTGDCEPGSEDGSDEVCRQRADV